MISVIAIMACMLAAYGGYLRGRFARLSNDSEFDRVRWASMLVRAWDVQSFPEHLEGRPELVEEHALGELRAFGIAWHELARTGRTDQALAIVARLVAAASLLRSADAVLARMPEAQDRDG